MTVDEFIKGSRSTLYSPDATSITKESRICKLKNKFAKSVSTYKNLRGCDTKDIPGRIERNVARTCRCYRCRCIGPRSAHKVCQTFQISALKAGEWCKLRYVHLWLTCAIVGCTGNKTNYLNH